MNFSNNKTPQNQSQTEKVVKSWSNPEIISKKSPTCKDVLKTANLSPMSTYIEQLEGAVSRTPSPAWEKISDKLSVAFQSAVLHEDTAQSALDKIAPELDALLAGEAS